MNKNLSLNIDIKVLLRALARIRLLAITLAIIALAGYTLYQISLITAISPDEATLAAEREKVDAARIKFDTQTIQAIGRQNQITASPDISNLGKSDPFYR